MFIEKEEAMRQATSYNSADIKPGSMMAKANKVREYNQRNSIIGIIMFMVFMDCAMEEAWSFPELLC